MKTTLDIAALVSAIIYPAVWVILFLMFRKELPEMIKGITGRLTKLEVAGISLELARADEFKPDWKGGTFDLRQRAASVNVNDSSVSNFSSQLRIGGMADYAVVNLGKGEEWLTSRLFIMALIFRRMKGVRGFVFLETTNEVRKRFVGWAEPDTIRWAFGQRYPWLETALALAYAEVIPNAEIVSEHGRLGYSYDKESADPSITLLRNFLGKIQSPVGNLLDEEWITLPSNDLTQEHARWLDAELLDDLLGDKLITTYIRQNEDDPVRPDQLKGYLAQPFPFIAVIRADHRFNYLVDRNKLLEQLPAH